MQTKLAQTAPDAVIVPLPLLPLMMTSSTEVGADAPPAPPLVALQFAVLLVFHVKEPPTAYLVAIYAPILTNDGMQPVDDAAVFTDTVSRVSPLAAVLWLGCVAEPSQRDDERPETAASVRLPVAS